MLIYFVIPAVVLAGLVLGGSIVYGMWKWDNCCPMPAGQAEGAIYFCRHGLPYKLGGLSWWSRPAWMRVTQNTALRIMISRLEAEADLILEASGREM